MPALQRQDQSIGVGDESRHDTMMKKDPSSEHPNQEAFEMHAAVFCLMVGVTVGLILAFQLLSASSSNSESLSMMTPANFCLDSPPSGSDLISSHMLRSMRKCPTSPPTNETFLLGPRVYGVSPKPTWSEGYLDGMIYSLYLAFFAW